MAKKQASQKPPYGSFKTTRAFLERLHKTVVPDHIDRSMMQGMSGDSQSEIISGFRFLNLLGEQDSALESLHSIVAAFDTDQWPKALADVINAAYAPIIHDLKIKTASSKMLQDRFRTYGVDGFMLARCIRFYLAALKEANVPFSPLLKAPTITRSKAVNPNSKRGGRNNTGKAGDDEGSGSGLGTVPEGYEVMPLPPGRKFTFPSDISTSDVTMITAVLSAYAARREEEQ